MAGQHSSLDDGPLAPTESAGLAIDIVVPRAKLRLWQSRLIERLRALGHDVALRPTPHRPEWSAAMDGALWLEHRLIRRGGSANLVQTVPQPTEAISDRPAVLIIDLVGVESAADVPVFSLAFDGQGDSSAALRAVIAGRMPDIAVIGNGIDLITQARPMVDVPASAVLALNDVLARAITAMVWAVTRFGQQNRPPPPRWSPAPSARTSLLAAYALQAAPRLVREVVRRQRYYYAHWSVGYRHTTGPGVAETGALGQGWTMLPDNGERFFADPFVFEHHGETHVFVEDFSHRLGKAVLSVSSFDADGQLGDPVPVIEEPYHLSYPQVFARDGNIWMLPESSAGENLVLYRATDYPFAWERHAVLIEGRQISDATLLDHGGRLWLFATERDGFGSLSDTLVVYSAQSLTGPWHPHRQNPICIDRAAARPGGAVMRTGQRIVLPIQDGTTGYGGHLGLCDLISLDEYEVVLSPVRPLASEGDWPYPRIHTLNSAGGVEVIDGIALPPRKHFWRRRR